MSSVWKELGLDSDGAGADAGELGMGGAGAGKSSRWEELGLGEFGLERAGARQGQGLGLVSSGWEGLEGVVHGLGHRLGGTENGMSSVWEELGLGSDRAGA